MTFTHSVKKEILKKNLQKCCKKAFLAGFIRASGAIIYKDGEYGFQYSSTAEGVTDFVSMLVKETFMVTANVYQEEDKLNNKTRETAEVVGAKGVEILQSLDIIKNGDISDGLDSEFLKKPCCRKSFLKGVFLGSGSCTVPNSAAKNTGYHLEVVFSHYQSAHAFVEFASGIGILFKVVQRASNVVAYIKSAEEIKDAFTIMGLFTSALKITELMIERDVLNNANRQKNCDLGNVSKQLVASEKYIGAIETIKETVGLDTLDSALKETAVAREAYPEETLIELSNRLKISKSCLNHRLRKLLEIANNLS